MPITEESQAVQAVVDRLVFKKRHTDDFQTTNDLTEWQQLGDKRKRCACPYWSCGVHDQTEGFKRRTTGLLRRVLKGRLMYCCECSVSGSF
jgi:hypothetical protein